MTPEEIPGRAGERVRALGPRAELRDMYDAEGSRVYADLVADDRFEVAEVMQAVRSLPGPVLDLACGAGRFTLPLLAAKREVTALDLSPHMLALLRERLDSAPQRLRDLCTVVCADMADFRLDRSFTHILLGTTTLSLLSTEQRLRLYRRVREHLAPGGRFHLSLMDRAHEGRDLDMLLTVTGAGGRAYDLYEHWPADAEYRTVTLLPSDPAPGRVVVCSSRVGVIGPDEVVKEMAEEGLTVMSRRVLGGAEHRTTLVTAGGAA